MAGFAGSSKNRLDTSHGQLLGEYTLGKGMCGKHF